MKGRIIVGRILCMITMMVTIVCGLERDAIPHGGGLNADGCHNNRKTGGYHCHRSSYSRGSSARSSKPSRPSKPKRPSMGVTVIPKAAVYIDGVYVGVSPIKSHRFEAGQRHFELKVVHPLLGAHTQSVDIDDNVNMHIHW